VSLETTLRLRPLVPAHAMLISESGIRTPEDVRRLHQAGVAGILVGEQLLRGTEDPAEAVRELMRGVRA
jgi:indole-3-glycerol phosphate synthase